MARVFVRREMHRSVCAIEQERIRIARDLHDELGAVLASIAVMCDRAAGGKKPNPASDARFTELGATARAAAKSLDEIVWAIHPQNDSLERVVAYLGEVVAEYLEAVGIEVMLELPLDLPQLAMSGAVRRHLLFAVKEAAGNVIKHADATAVSVRVTVSHRELCIVISDNGCGLDAAASGVSGDGLRNMRQRLAEIGGSAWAESRPGGGTMVSFQLPFSGSSRQWTKRL